MTLPFPHLPAESWERLLRDELDGETQDRVLRHAAGCPDCRRLLLAHDPSRAFSLAPAPVPEGTWDGFWEAIEPQLAPRRRRWTAAVAAAAGLAGLALLALTMHLTVEPPEDPCAAPEMAALRLTQAECEALFSGEIADEERHVIVVRDLDLRGIGL